MAGVPHQGGATWAVLQYVLGLRRLGFEVTFVEPLPLPAGSAAPAPEIVRYFSRVCDAFDLHGSAALLLSDRRTVGLPYGRLESAASRADLLLNMAGMLRDPRLTGRVPHRLYLDLDPAFTQLWAEEGIDVGLEGHTHFATVGLSLGTPGCDVPTLGLDWIPTLQPIVLDEWPAHARVRRQALTTVGNWRSYGSVERAGRFYGQKAHAFREYFNLPERTGARFELALSIHPDEVTDLEALSCHGWTLLDPARVAGTPEAYREYIGGSWAEIGIAKSGYVEGRCGWFSDRSVCYLASGKPVLAQETGFSKHLPTGLGLLRFGSPEEAADGVAALRSDYDRHARASREIAETYFRSEVVLSELLQRVGVHAEARVP